MKYLLKYKASNLDKNKINTKDGGLANVPFRADSILTAGCLPPSCLPANFSAFQIVCNWFPAFFFLKTPHKIKKLTKP